MTDGDGQFTLDGPVILDAVEASSDAEFAALVGRLRDPASVARAEAMRADRAALAGLRRERAPEGLLARAESAVFGEVDPEELARLEDGVPLIDGVPVSRVRVFGVPVWSRALAHRRAIGFAAAAALLAIAVFGVPAGLDALRGGSRWANGSGMFGFGGDDGGMAAGPGGGGSVGTGGLGGGAGVSDRGVGDGAGVGGGPGVIGGAGSGFGTRAEADAAWRRWGARPLADVFEAAPLLGSGRLIVHARSGSPSLTGAFLAKVAGQRIGVDHSFEVADGLARPVVDLIGMPRVTPGALAGMGSLEAGDVVRVVVPERSGWVARVRPGAASLAALRKRLEEGGLTVTFFVLDAPVVIADDADGGAGDPAGADAGDTAPARRRAVAVPVVVDTLPD